jgi:Ca-activated chloride channel family protein
MRHAIQIIVLLFLAFLLTPALAEDAPAAGKAMIVLDASGSMWGKIGDEPKIEIARRTIRDLLKDWDPRIELGLAAYGHRRKGDCGDIEILVPVGKGNEARILNAMGQLQPKGKTPLSDAVRMAAEALKYTEERATVILVSDGQETCEADPCKLGQALESSGVDFTTHVIGFDVKQEEEAGLRCLAKYTGGLYLSASDAGGLKKALETTVTEVKKQAEAPPPKPKPAAADQGIKLVALYGAGGAEFKGPINWFLQEKQQDLNGKRKQVAEQHRGNSGQVFRDIPPGNYVVVAELSDARYIRREFEIEVKAGEAAVHQLPLDIGTVRFDAALSEGGKAFAGDLGWTVLSPKADLSGQHQKLTDFWRVKSGGVFLLPAGEWLINAEIADARYIKTQKQIKVEPGSEEAHSFVFQAGRVRFDAGLAEGGDAFQGDLGWTVLSPKTDLAGAHQKVTDFWRVKSGAIFLLPAGEWLISGEIADARYIKTQKQIKVEPDGEEAHRFIFNAGTVRLSAKLAPQSAEFKGQLAWSILSPKADLSGAHKELTNFWRVNSGSVYLLPAGDWLVRGTLPDHRHVKGELNLSLKPGEQQQKELVYNAGEVRIDATLDGAPYPGQLGWEVLAAKADAEGKHAKVVDAWRVQSGQVTILQAGDYLLRAVVPDHRETKGETTFSVAAGESKAVTVDLRKP